MSVFLNYCCAMFSMSKGNFVHFVLQSTQSLQVFCQSDAMDGLIEMYSPCEMVLLCKNSLKRPWISNNLDEMNGLKLAFIFCQTSLSE